MSTTALYKALVEAGASKDAAERAVKGLAHTEEGAAKTDLAELKVELIKWMVVLTEIIIAAVGFFSDNGLTD